MRDEPRKGGMAGGQACGRFWDTLAKLTLQESDGSDRFQALDCLGFEDGGLVAISSGGVFNEPASSKSVSDEQKSIATKRSPFPTSSC